jgi:hypothetical protein
MNPTSFLFGLRFVWNPFFLLAGALSFYEKIHQSVALFLFGLQDVKVSSNILLAASIGTEPPLLVQRCNGTNARLGHLEVVGMPMLKFLLRQ